MPLSRALADMGGSSVIVCFPYCFLQICNFQTFPNNLSLFLIGVSLNILILSEFSGFYFSISNKVFTFCLLFQTFSRAVSAPPYLPDPREEVYGPTFEMATLNNVEPDPGAITPSAARFLLSGIDRRLIQLLNVGFRYCRTRGQIAETLEAGQLHDDDLRRAVIAAMARGWRLCTLILLAVRSYQPEY
jgi:hypothetical protein